MIDSTVFRAFSFLLASLLLLYYSQCLPLAYFSSRNLQRNRPKYKNDKKRSTFQRALARVSESNGTHSGPGLAALVFYLPALHCQPSTDKMSMSMSDPSRKKPRTCRATLFPCPTLCSVQYCVNGLRSQPPHPPSAGVSGCASRSGFPHSKLVAVPVVPVVPLSCHPTPHSRPTPPMGPSRITTRKLSVVHRGKRR